MNKKAVRYSDPGDYRPGDKDDPRSPWHEGQPITYRSRLGSEVTLNKDGEISNYDFKQRDVLDAIDENPTVLAEMEEMAETALLEKTNIEKTTPKKFNFSYRGASFECNWGNYPVNFSIQDIINKKEVLAYYGLTSYAITDQESFNAFVLSIINYKKWSVMKPQDESRLSSKKVKIVLSKSQWENIGKKNKWL